MRIDQAVKELIDLTGDTHAHIDFQRSGDSLLTIVASWRLAGSYEDCKCEHITDAELRNNRGAIDFHLAHLLGAVKIAGVKKRSVTASNA